MVVYSDDKGSNPTTVAKLTLTGQPKPEPPPGAAKSGMFESKRPGSVVDNATQYFQDLQVKPQLDSAVTFAFQTATPSEFFVEISKQRPDPTVPVRVRPGQPLGAAFSANTQLAAFTVPGLSGVKWKHEVTLRGAAGQVLEANATYFFMITAKASDRSYWRHVGRFTMAGLDVRIVWEKIKIINDSDDVGCGDLDLWFWANYGKDGGKFLGVTRFNENTACTDRTPVLTATSNHSLMITLHWGSDSADNYTLGNVQLYRDGRITFDGKKYGGFTSEYTDTGKMIDAGNATGQPLRPNSEYTYKVCFIGFGDADGQTKCSNEITAMGQPLAPTAPVDVSVAALPLHSRSSRGGAIMLRPTPKISVTWRNTDVPGQFITIEALDTLAPGDSMAGGAIQGAPQHRWIEATRLSAKDNPTTVTINRPVSLITSSTGLTTYRVCAVVPKLGDTGKACSAPNLLR